MKTKAEQTYEIGDRRLLADRVLSRDAASSEARECAAALAQTIRELEAQQIAVHESYVEGQKSGLRIAARIVDHWSLQYPYDLFPDAGTSKDAIAGTAMRKLLPRLACDIRDRALRP